VGDPQQSTTRILLVQTADAHHIRLRDVLAGRPELTVVHEATTTRDAIESTARLHPDVVVMDVGLSDVAGHDVMRSLRSVSPATRVVLHARAADVDAPGTDGWLAQMTDIVVDPARAPDLAWRLELPGSATSVPLARASVAGLLSEWGLPGSVDVAGLLVSELVANAVQHVHGSCALEVTHHAGVLRIGVTDRGPGMPDPRSLEPSAENGRGLHIISALSEAWGVDQLAGTGKHVWAELARGGVQVP
jgi:CheY-like chemotaxis protein